MKRGILGVVSGAMLLLISLPLPAHNDGVLLEALRQCREYSDIENRLACYDAIGEPTSVTGATVNAPQKVEYGSQYPDATDDIGLPKSDDVYEPIRATVVRCGEANNRKFYFYFDNGQVWQYIGIKRLRYKSCNAPANLSEDGFGFKLQMDGESGQLRVRRVK